MSDSTQIPETTTPIAKRSARLKQWLAHHRWLVGGIGVACVVAATALAWVFLWPQGGDVHLTNIVATPTPSPTPEPKTVQNPLNGVMYTATEAQAWSSWRPLAVMVENHVQARPQSGLNQADILYEAMAEGGITRFMAVFLAGQPDKIGPVRSARMHYVDWANEWDGIYAHWGGSAEALAYLGSHSRPKNLDQFANAGAFYRDTSQGKSLEHTGYASTASLRAVAQKNGWEQATASKSWTFKSDAEATDRPAAQTVNIAFLGNAGYQGKFEYRSATNDYARSTGGAPHVDADGQVLIAKTIVLQYQTAVGYTDAGGHAAVRVTTTGTGRAVVIQDGVATEGTWTKSSQQARTMFTDDNGQDMPLNRGKIWIVSVPTGSSVTF